MIIRSLIAFLICTLIYVMGFEGMHPKLTNAFPQYRMHFRNAEEVLYSEGQSDTVLVGSSLIATPFIYEIPPRDWVNFGLRGGGALTGLEVLRSCGGKNVKMVMIEVNLLAHAPDSVVVDNSCGYAKYHLKKLKAFREVSRPVNVFAAGMDKAFTQLGWPYAKAVPLTKAQQRQFQQKVAEQVQTKVKLNTALLATILKDLRTKGVALAFVEAPLPTRNQASLQQMRKQIQTTFPEVPYFSPKDPEAYTYSDGSHMDAASCKKYVIALRSWLKQKSPKIGAQ